MTAEISSRDDVFKSTKSLSGSPGEMSATFNYSMGREVQDSFRMVTLNCPHEWPVWEVRRGFWDWIAHGQWVRAEQAEWITWLLCHSLHVSTSSPRLSAGSVVKVTTLSFHWQRFLLEDMLSKFEICWLTNGFLHLDDFQFRAVSRHSNATQLLAVSLFECSDKWSAILARLEWEFCLTHSTYFCN